MITNTTPAAAPANVINSEQKQLVFFGVGSTSQTSQTFTVDQQPFYLSAYNLATGDVVTIQQVFGQGSGTEVASFAPVNGPVTLTPARTKVRIDHPGRYQLLHSGPSALGTFTVAGGAAVMTSDPLGDLAEALYQIFTTLGGNITVTAPITLTGAGTTASPYVIGFQAGTVIGSSNVTVTGAGTTASPYIVSVAGLNEASGAGNILNTADAGKVPVLFTDGSLHTSLLGWEILNLGSSSSSISVDFRTSRVQQLTISGGGTVTIDVTNLPAMPGFLVLKIIQGTLNTQISFTGAWAPSANLFNSTGTLQPAGQGGSTTIYTAFYDGVNCVLLSFGSDTGQVGAFNGTNSSYVGGDNVVRPLTNIAESGQIYGTAAGTNTYTSTITAFTGYSTGGVMYVTFTNANTGAATLNINGLGAKTIQRRNVAVTTGQIPALSTLQLLYDGVNLQIVGAT